MLDNIRQTMVGVFSNKKLLIVLVLAAIFIAAAIWVYNNYVKPRVDAAYVPNKEFIQGDNNAKQADLYFFYTTWCPHCKTAKPVWEKFQNENPEIDGVKINYIAVDCEKDPELAEQYKIEGYPTIKLSHKNQVVEYDAQPDPNTLMQFLKSVISSK